MIRESLLHVRIFRVNPVLGYMHTSLAFGWFLLIAVGWIEVVAYLGSEFVPLQGHVFFKYFAAGKIANHIAFFDFAMDLLLAIVLSGVLLAWFKRLRSKAMGMRRTTKHTTGDRIALSFLWFVFPLRLAAESITAAIYGGGGFLTGSIGKALHNTLGTAVLENLYEPSWWLYSCALGGFFIALPFSRYMHIFTEIPLIFLRNYKLRPTHKESTYDNFEVQACSRCGICIDPCQLQSELGINNVQSVYFLRDRRYNMLSLSVANDCLMCGRCEAKCPVGINLNTLRLNSRDAMRNIPDERRYGYLRGLDRSEGSGRVGYFAGCMTLLTPKTLNAMERIFESAGEEVWWADRNASETDRAQINLKTLLIIGCAQALALMPGVSRSGITITAALFLGFSRSQSARISFLLSAPVIGGAAMLELTHLSWADINAPLVWGFISAFLGALVVICGLMKYIKTHSFNVFVIYRLLLGLVIIGWYWHLH